MPKQVRHDKGVILNHALNSFHGSFQNPILKFDIDLTFACLPVGRDFEI
jgi:hypothetical protein